MRKRLMAAAVLVTATAALAAAFDVGQTVEVREGDVWSRATVTAVEGRRVQIKYDDGTLEWVPPARVRTPDAAATRTAATPGKGSIEKPAAAEKLPGVGMKCEAKEALTWKPATVKNRDGDLFLVVFDGWENKMFWAWVSSDCVRTPGSTKAGPHWAEKVGVGGQSVPAAKAQAQAKLAEWKAKAAEDKKKADDDIDRAFAGTRADAARAAAEKLHGKPGPFDPAPYDKPVAPANRAAVRTLKPTLAIVKNYTPDAMPTNKDPRPLALGNDARGRFRDLIVSTYGVLAVYEEGKNLAQIKTGSLQAGVAAPAVDFDPLSKPFAVSDDAKLVIGRSDNFFGGTKQRLDLFDVAGDALKHRVSFEPYGDEKNKNDRDVTFAAFVGGKLLTSNNNGDLTCWDIGAGKVNTAPVAAVWNLPLPDGAQCVLSPTGKSLAAVGKSGVFVIEILTGTVRQYIPDGRRVSKLAFTPDGRMLLGLGGPSVVSWDLVAGKIRPDVGLLPGLPADDIVGVAPGYALIGGKYLFDIAHNAIVWQYDGAADTFYAAGSTWARVQADGKQTLVAADLPDAAARGVAVNTADALLRRGDRVSVEINIDADAATQDKIRQNFERQLARDGIGIADGQPVKLVVKTENGKTTRETWARMGVPPWSREGTDVDITDKISSVRFERDGKIAWQTFTTNRVGGTVRTQAGQGVADAVQAANKFNLGFFDNVVLPGIVPRPVEKPKFGASKWTVAGLVAGG